MNNTADFLEPVFNQTNSEVISFDAIHQHKVAETYLAQGMITEAIAACQQALNLHPNLAAAYKTLGNAYLSQNQLAQAQAAYTQAITLDPQLAEPYANLGNIVMQAGQVEQAIQYYQQAIALKPNLAGAYWMLGNALLQQGNAESALQHYQEALKIQPRLVQFSDLYKLAKGFSSQGYLQSAIVLYHHALTLNSQVSGVHCDLGIAYMGLRQLDDALSHLQAAITLKPDYAEAYCNLGAVYGQKQMLTEAIAALQRAIELEPHLPEAHSNLGIALLQQSQLSEAVSCFEAAIKLKPDFAEARYNLGDTLLKLNQVESAAHHLQTAIHYLQSTVANHPQHAKAHYLLACAYSEQDNANDAIAHCLQALAIQPNHAEAHSTLSSLFFQQDDLLRAETHARKAIELLPSYADAYCNLGAILCEQRRFTEAIAIYERALALQFNDPVTHLNLGMALLTVGDFQRGWAEYEWRWQAPDMGAMMANFKQPLWKGEDIKDKTLLVWTEQGLGDTLQFIRLLPIVSKLCKRVILSCPQNLMRLLSSYQGEDLVVIENSTPPHLPEFDVHVPLLNLLRILQTNFSNIPADVPYLSPVEIEKSYQLPVSSLSQLKVGFVWSSGYRPKGNLLKVHHHKSSTLEMFLSLLEIPNIDLYSLQIGIPQGTITTDFSDRLHDLQPHIKDFADTAHLVNQLDLVISVDTSVAHLAGAMAKPTWILLPFAADWRWLTERTDTPWYPTARLFRQPRARDWDSVFFQVKQALVKLPDYSANN